MRAGPTARPADRPSGSVLTLKTGSLFSLGSIRSLDIRFDESNDFLDDSKGDKEKEANETEEVRAETETGGRDCVSPGPAGLVLLQGVSVLPKAIRQWLINVGFARGGPTHRCAFVPCAVAPYFLWHPSISSTVAG